MRLYVRKDVWYVEVSRGHSFSLKTSDARIARKAFHEFEKKSLSERLYIIEKPELKLLSEFISEYQQHRSDREKLTPDRRPPPP